jgi:glucuronate isomerase
MTHLIHDRFLLKTDMARQLYHEFAEGLPIIDYHCHLNPQDLATDRSFANLAQLWVTTDPYKHRAMRIAGIPEKSITGPATDREKFDCWAATMPKTLGNPLFHWTALELQRYFGISERLDSRTAEMIWNTCNHLLQTPEFSARALLTRAPVECVCTSDQLLDDLQAHALLAKSAFKTKILPSLRADDLLAVESPGYREWLKRLGTVTGITADSFAAFQQAVNQRLDYFAQVGCRISDHALDDFLYSSVTADETAALFNRRISGGELTRTDYIRLKSGMLCFLGHAYAQRNWAMQLHIGAQRQTSTRLRQFAGPAGGYAGIGKACDIPSLCQFLDELELAGCLPKTVLYSLNPTDYAALTVLTGSYAQDGIRSKIQFGPAWWYNDHALGIRQHLDIQAHYGLLSTFIGMTTDSRSLLSMTRHEYFRRMLCDYLGDQVEAGVLPSDQKLLGELVKSISYENARDWFFPPQSQ